MLLIFERYQKNKKKEKLSTHAQCEKIRIIHRGIGIRRRITAAHGGEEPSKLDFHDGVAPNTASILSHLALRTLLPRPQAPHAARRCRGSHLRRRAPDSVLRVGSLARRVDSASRSWSRRVHLLLRRNPRPLRGRHREADRSLLHRRARFDSMKLFFRVYYFFYCVGF